MDKTHVGIRGDVDVIGDEIFFEACVEGLFQFERGIYKKGVFGGGDEDLGLEASFCIGDAGRNGVTREKGSEILGELSVEIADPVGTGDAEVGAERQ
jgi:hypothetical protein